MQPGLQIQVAGPSGAKVSSRAPETVQAGALVRSRHNRFCHKSKTVLVSGQSHLQSRVETNWVLLAHSMHLVFAPEQAHLVLVAEQYLQAVVQDLAAIVEQSARQLA